MIPYVIRNKGMIGLKFYELPEGIKQIELYHGTTSAFLDDILSKGINPREFTDKSNYEGSLLSDPKNVYLAAFIQAVAGSKNGIARHGGNMVLIKLIMDTSTLLPDEDSGVLEEGAIKFRQPRDWKESLEYLGTCAYKGIISPANFTEIVEYDPCN